jgi:hypothetical protein
MEAGCSVMSTPPAQGVGDSWRPLQTAADRTEYVEASRHKGTEAKAAAGGVRGHGHGQTYGQTYSGIAATLAIQAARSTRDAVEEPFAVKQTTI